MISEAHEGGSTCVLWLGDGAVASGGLDGSVALWRAPAPSAGAEASAASGGAPRLLRREAGASWKRASVTTAWKRASWGVRGATRRAKRGSVFRAAKRASVTGCILWW